MVLNMKLTTSSVTIIIILWLFFFGCDKSKDNESKSTIPTVYYKVKTTWPHDTEAFTQGLVIHNGVLYESTGQEKRSWIGVIDIKTGKPDKKVVMEDQYFGEGITIMNDKVYQLTYKNKVGFVYDLKTFKRVREFPLPSAEGWGITNDSINLMTSDGTDKIFFLDTATLKPVRTISVTDDVGVVDNLNELEYVEGYIFANQWQTNNIVKIDPATGKVVARMDLTSLAQNAALRNPEADVLNGIAYHSGTKLFLVTGKNWPSIYVLQLNQKTP
jgi:glutaminyl-peptide cyclotransferase